jgi:hypothetical protein
MLARHAPAKAVTDLPPWAAMVVKLSSDMMSKVDIQCREYFASRSACSLSEVRILGSGPKVSYLPFDFL